MKAEHRKELQTNALADRMGRFIKRVKQRPSRGAFLWVVLILLVVLAAAFYFMRQRSGINREAKLWGEFALGDIRIGEDERQQPIWNYSVLMQQKNLVGRAATLQRAWEMLHDQGIKVWLADNFTAVQNVDRAQKIYESVFPEVKDDPVLAPEVKYALAVIEETRAGQRNLSVTRRTEHLNKAAQLYQGVADEYKDSAHAAPARKRAEMLKNPEQRTHLLVFYLTLGERAGRGFDFLSDIPGGHPPIPIPPSPPKKK
jgi:hypothetical protein